MLSDASMLEFFDQALTEAQDGHGVELSDLSRYYLVRLLADRGREAPAPGATLAELRLQAAQLPPSRSAPLYRELGDQALYVGGYFPDSLRGVGVDYCARMGGAAYACVAGSRRDALSEMFWELARGFRGCLALLSDVSRQTRAAAQTDLLALYELWLTTRDRHAAKRLIALGMLPAEPASG